MIDYRQSQWFRYAVPEGWRVAEEGQFAIALIAPDSRAGTVMTGNAGLPPAYPPLQFLHERLSVPGPQQLAMGSPRPAPPMASFTGAIEAEYSCTIGGIPCQGLARCHVALSYDMAMMVATWAGSEVGQWAGYASWLPGVADDVAITSAEAFGAGGIMRQNLQNSISLGAQARVNREHAQAQWAEVTQLRGDSVDRQHAAFRENLGNVTTWSNPYGYADMQLTNDYSHYWIERGGRVVGTDNPHDDPRWTLTGEWSRLKPVPPA